VSGFEREHEGEAWDAEPRGVPELTDGLRALRGGGGGCGGGVPDLSARILGAVGERRPFRNGWSRVGVGVFRAISVGVIGLLGGAVVLVQGMPEVVRLSPVAERPRPMTALVQQARAEAQRGAAEVGSILVGTGRSAAERRGPAAEVASWAPRARVPMVLIGMPEGSRGVVGGRSERPGVTAVSFAEELSQSLSERGLAQAR
jgi:hypothetical protein